MPPQTRASLPPLPAALDRDPELLGILPNGEMGTLAIDSAEMSVRYGVLGVRYNTLRQFYLCVREAVNSQKDVEVCL